MPPTTRRSASSRTSSGGQQSTLNFRSASKVTKAATAATGPGKQSLLDKQQPQRNEVSVVIPIKEKAPTSAALEEDKEEHKGDVEKSAKKERKAVTSRFFKDEPTTKDKAAEEAPGKDSQEEREEEEAVDDTKPTGLTTLIPPPTIETPLSLPSITTTTALLNFPNLDTLNLPIQVTSKLTSLTPKSINNYYDAILSARKTSPVHQSYLTRDEKILRHFDLSSNYGPCVGITRLNRWLRAYRLGLKPPVEVLAVILEVEGKEGAGKGEGKGKDGMKNRDERLAYLDEELSTRNAKE